MDAIYDNHNFISVCEFLPNQLYFVTVQNINNGGSCEAVIPHTDDIHFFNTDNELIYHNFYGDFGPLGITSLYKFCKKITNKLATYAGDIFYEKFTNSRFGRKEIAEKLREKFIKKKIVVYYTSTNNEKRANAAYLIASYAVLYLGYSPRLAYKALQPTKMRYRAFQDASVGLSPYKINMKDCLDALHKASVFGFFNFNDFNAAECNYYENIEHGGLNWVIPQKFIAFPGPVEEKNDYYQHPNFYIEYFLCNNVTDIIRLNQRAYDPKCFTLFNLKHHDLYMQDGTDPPDSILRSFMNIVETASGAIAVHCKAGLGRTGSLIGAYLLKHYRMTAKEAIAWIRICRPGSVIGHQQTWLESHEEKLWYEGNDWRYKTYGKTEIVPFLQYGIYSFESPKKEFPGLRELLANMTKKSRYRFIAKNRTKKSKTRLHQVIKNLLENGKPIKDASKPPNKIEKPQDIAAVEQIASFTSQTTHPSQNTILINPKLSTPSTKNVQYLKPPPQVEEIKQPNNYEYMQHEYRKPPPQKNPFSDFEPLPPPQQQQQQQLQQLQQLQQQHLQLQPQPQQQQFNYPKMEYYTPNYQSLTNYDNDLQAMYANPNAFYSNPSENEYAHYGYEKRLFAPQINTRKPVKRPEMPKVYSGSLSPEKYEKPKPNLLSKSIDKNWKQNQGGYYSTNAINKLYPTPPHNLQPMRYPPNEEVCAFDTRVDTISQYSRFNKPFLHKGYLDTSQVNTAVDNDYYSETKLKSLDYTKCEGRAPQGFLLSPEDLQSWVETFDDKVDDFQTEKHYRLKKSSIT